jgi:hypothetical protein
MEYVLIANGIAGVEASLAVRDFNKNEKSPYYPNLPAYTIYLLSTGYKKRAFSWCSR